MRRTSISFLFLILAFASLAFAAADRRPWPTVEQQVKKDNVLPGTPLESLIQQNQDFGLLRPEEAGDKIPVPLWLRVYWRKGHPETPLCRG